MLKLSKEQLTVLEDQRNAAFVERAVAFVRDQVPEAERYEKARLQRALRQLQSNAAAYGLTSERALVVMLAASVKLQHNVLEEPLLVNILTDERRSEAERIAYVDGWCFQ